MDRKTLLALAAVAATSATFAAVTAKSDNTLCRIKVTTTTQETLIGLPLVDVGSTEGNTVNVTNFVLTTDLPKDTTLQYKNDQGKWLGWIIVKKNDNSVWEAAKVGDDTIATESLARGKSVLLTLPKAPSTSQVIYLYGQWVADTMSFNNLASGYHLLANPGSDNLTKVNLETVCGITPAEGDLITVPVMGSWKIGDQTVTMPSMETFSYKKNNGWNGDFSIPAGQGFWYKKAASSNTTTSSNN